MMFVTYVLVALFVLSYAQELPKGIIISYSTTEYPSTIPNSCACTNTRMWQGEVYIYACSGSSCFSTYKINENSVIGTGGISFPQPTNLFFITPTVQFYWNDPTINATAQSNNIIISLPYQHKLYIRYPLGIFEVARYRFTNTSLISYAPIPHLVNFIASSNRLHAVKIFSPYANITPVFRESAIYSLSNVNISCGNLVATIREPGNRNILTSGNQIFVTGISNYVFNGSSTCSTYINTSVGFDFITQQNNTLLVTFPITSRVDASNILSNPIYATPSTHLKEQLNIPDGLLLNITDVRYRYWKVIDPQGRCWFGEANPGTNAVIATMPIPCDAPANQTSATAGFYNNTINYNNTCKFNYNNTHVTINYTHTFNSSTRVVKINKSGSIVTNVSLNSNAQLVFNRETDYVLGVYTSDFRNVICYYREQYTNMNNNVQRFFHLLFILLSSAVPLSVLFVIPAYAIGIFSNIPVFTIIHALSLSSLIYFFTRGQFHMFTLPIFLIITSVLVNYNIELPSPPSSWGVVETLFALPIALINFIIELFRLPYSLVIHIFNSLPGEFSAFEWLAQTIGLAINTYFILYAFTIIYNRFQR